MRTTAVIAIVVAIAFPVLADFTINGGELGTATIKTAEYPYVIALLDRFDPPAVDEETGEPVPRALADYKPILIKYIRQRGWAPVANAIRSGKAAAVAAANPVTVESGME